MLSSDPFEPFVIEFEDGRRLTIERTSLAINNGGAGFLSENDGLVDFSCTEVRRVTQLSGKDVSP